MPSACTGVVGVVGSSWFEGVGEGWVVGFWLGGVGVAGVLEGREWVGVSGLWTWFLVNWVER